MANDHDVEVYIDRLIGDPEFIRQCREAERKWDRWLRDSTEGDEATAAEMRAGIVNVDELRRRYGRVAEKGAGDGE